MVALPIDSASRHRALARRLLLALLLLAAGPAAALDTGEAGPFEADTDGAGGAASPPLYDADGLTLADAFSQALDRGFDARIARLESGRAEAAAAESRGSYYPNLNFTGSGGWSNRLNKKLRAVDNNGQQKKYGLANLRNDPWISVEVSQNLLDLSRWRGAQREEITAEAARIAETGKREAVAFEITRAYAGTLRSQSFVEEAHVRREAAAWLDEQARLLFEAGRAVESERDRVLIHLDDAEMTRLAAAGGLDDARAMLWLAMGESQPPEPCPELSAASLPNPAYVRPSPEALEEGVRSAPDMRVLALRRRAGELGVAAARAGRYPKVELRGGYAHYGIKRFDNFDDEAYVYVGMQLPIFDGFRAKNAIAGAQKEADLARLRYQSALAAKRGRVRELLRSLELAERKLDLAERRAAASNEQLRLADLSLRSQRGSLDEALEARERASMDRIAAIDARYQRLETWAALERELGRLSGTVSGTSQTAALPAALP